MMQKKLELKFVNLSRTTGLGKTTHKLYFMNIGIIRAYNEFLVQKEKIFEQFDSFSDAEMILYNRENVKHGDRVYEIFNTTDGQIKVHRVIDEIHTNTIKFESGHTASFLNVRKIDPFSLDDIEKFQNRL